MRASVEEGKVMLHPLDVQASITFTAGSQIHVGHSDCLAIIVTTLVMGIKGLRLGHHWTLQSPSLVCHH